MTQYEKIKEDQELFMARLKELDPLVYQQVLVGEERVEITEQIHKQASNAQTAENVREARRELQDAYKAAEHIITCATKPTFNDSSRTTKAISESQYDLSTLGIDEQLQSDCLAIATQIANRVAAPSEIARNTGLTVFRVLSLMRDGEFLSRIEVFDKQLSPLDSAEARTLKQLERSLTAIVQERAIYATTAEELSDTEMIMLGLNPNMRDLDMAMTPGGKTGLMKMVPITTRKVIGSKTRMVTEKVPELDAEIVNLQLKIAERLTSLRESGQSGSSKTINTYVRRKEKNEPLVNEPLVNNLG